MDRFGFPRTSAKAAREVKGFRTGGMVQSVVPSGKKAGTHIGKVAVRMGIGIYQKQVLLSALKNRVSAPMRFHE
jgi:hypothetical protein